MDLKDFLFGDDNSNELTPTWVGGTALDEGMTEYFSNKLLQSNSKKNDVKYSMFVGLVKDLVNLYGEDEILYSCVKSPKRLEELMAKDGKSLKEFINLTDTCHRNIYLKLPPSESEKINLLRQKEVQKNRNEVTKFLDDIREKRLKENPEMVLPESHWKEEMKKYEQYEIGIKNKTIDSSISYENYLEGYQKTNEKTLDINKLQKLKGLSSNEIKNDVTGEVPKKSNKVVEWLKNLKEKITSKFKKDDKPLLLNSGEEVNSLSTKRNEFLDSIKVSEEDMIIQDDKKSEHIQMKALEKDDDELVR